MLRKEAQSRAIFRNVHANAKINCRWYPIASRVSHGKYIRSAITNSVRYNISFVLRQKITDKFGRKCFTPSWGARKEGRLIMLNSQYWRQRCENTLIRHYPAVAVPRRLYDGFLAASLRHILLSVFANAPATPLYAWAKGEGSTRHAFTPIVSPATSPFFLSFLPPWVHFLVAVSSFSLPGRSCETSCSRTEVTRFGNSLVSVFNDLSVAPATKSYQEIAIGCIFKRNKSFFVTFVKNNVQWSASGFSFSAALLRKQTAFGGGGRKKRVKQIALSLGIMSFSRRKILFQRSRQYLFTCISWVSRRKWKVRKLVCVETFLKRVI